MYTYVYINKLYICVYVYAYIHILKDTKKDLKCAVGKKSLLTCCLWNLQLGRQKNLLSVSRQSHTDVLLTSSPRRLFPSPRWAPLMGS